MIIPYIIYTCKSPWIIYSLKNILDGKLKIIKKKIFILFSYICLNLVFYKVRYVSSTTDSVNPSLQFLPIYFGLVAVQGSTDHKKLWYSDIDIT